MADTLKPSLLRSRLLDVTQRSLGGALRDIQKTAAKETISNQTGSETVRCYTQRPSPKSEILHKFWPLLYKFKFEFLKYIIFIQTTSPIKTTRADKRTANFDLQLQTSNEATLRVVCYSPKEKRKKETAAKLIWEEQSTFNPCYCGQKQANKWRRRTYPLKEGISSMKL